MNLPQPPNNLIQLQSKIISKWIQMPTLFSLKTWKTPSKLNSENNQLFPSPTIFKFGHYCKCFLISRRSEKVINLLKISLSQNRNEKFSSYLATFLPLSLFLFLLQGKDLNNETFFWWLFLFERKESIIIISDFCLSCRSYLKKNIFSLIRRRQRAKVLRKIQDVKLKIIRK
jgi:hypothetical protein